MDGYRVVLFLHFLSLFVGIGAGVVLMVCLFQLRAAQTVEAAAPWGRVAGKTDRAFPVAVLGLFATGAYMTSHLWTWSTSWVDVGIAALAYLALVGPLVGARTSKALERALHANGPGPLGPEARRMTLHPGLWVTEFGNFGIVLGVVWNMTQKPGIWESIIAVAIGLTAGASVALGVTSRPKEVEAPAAASTTA